LDQKSKVQTLQKVQLLLEKGQLAEKQAFIVQGMGQRLTWSSLGKAAMLFWNGYATHLPFIHTYDTRSNTFHALSPDPARTQVGYN